MEGDQKGRCDASLSLGVTIGSAAKAGRHEIVPRSAPLPPALPGLGLHTEHTLLLVHVYRSVDAMQSTESFKAPPRAGEASWRAKVGYGQARREAGIFLWFIMITTEHLICW
jgi:hypothetical protein